MRPGLEISLLAISGRLIQEKAHCCWKRGQQHCSGLVAAFLAACNGYGYTPTAIFSVDDTVMHCRMYLCVPECTCYK